MNRTSHQTTSHQTTELTVGITPVRPVRLYAQVVEGLLDLLREGSLTPGTRLPPERELAARFEVSRASMRQALTAVEVLGFVQVRQGSGTYVVAAPGPRDPASDGVVQEVVSSDVSPLEILESRLLIEPGIARLAALRRTDDDVAAMGDLVAGMFSDIEAGRDAWISDWGFHTVLALATKNASLQLLTAEFQQQMSQPVWELLRARNLSRGEHSQRYMHDHGDILAAVRDQDADAAADLMSAHIDHVIQDLDEEEDVGG